METITILSKLKNAYRTIGQLLFTKGYIWPTCLIVSLIFLIILIKIGNNWNEESHRNVSINIEDVAYGGDGRAVIYYAGHGIPDEASKSAYLLPTDGIGSDVGTAYSLEKLYQALSEMPAKSITVFLDACFSGAKRDGGMMASARGVAIKAKAEELKAM